VSLRKTLNAILGPSSLPVVVAQSDKPLQTKPFFVGVVRQIEHTCSYARISLHFIFVPIEMLFEIKFFELDAKYTAYKFRIWFPFSGAWKQSITSYLSLS